MSDPPVLLILGDSLSAAHGMQVEQGWVSLLQTRLKQQQYSYAVVNASASGETTDGGLTRLPALLDTHRPIIVLLELGANDGLRALPPARIQANLQRLISLSQQAGARVMTAGVRLPPNYGAAYEQAFQRVYQAAADMDGVVHLPRLLLGVSEDRALVQADGLHPTVQAQPLILDNVWPVLEPLLRQGGASD